MNLDKRINEFLTELIKITGKNFDDELSTDENADYRRGFLAGTLYAQLQLKAEIFELSLESKT